MSAIGISVWAYGALLSVAVLSSIAVEGRSMVRTALALLANWAAHMAWWSLTADPSPYVFSIIVDTATAVIILTRPAGRMQALIGWSLLIQITIHFAYALHVLGGGYAVEAEARYWTWLDWIALAQIVLVGGGVIGGIRHRLARAAVHRDHPHAHDPSSVVGP